MNRSTENTLDAPTAEFSREEGRTLLTSLVVPRPIAWISTFSEKLSGSNLAPFSSVAPVCNKPILLSFSSGRKANGTRKDTAVNVLANGEFVVNFVDTGLIEKVALSATEWHERVNEFDVSGVTQETSRSVRPPSVREALASLECRLVRHLEFGDGDARVDLLIGEVVHARLRRPITQRMEDESPTAIFRGIGALGLDWYLMGGTATFLPAPVDL